LYLKIKLENIGYGTPRKKYIKNKLHEQNSLAYLILFFKCG